MAYAGIDYGLGTSNIDTASGIRYGVIAMNSINLDYSSDFEPEYGEPHCPKCGAVVVSSDDASLPDADWNEGKDYACVACESVYWSDAVFPDESQGWSYDRDGYTLTDCLDNDIFVLQSPYFTYAQFCSPCVPGAGNLDTPISAEDGGAKCYALGHDWFDDKVAPYPVYRVSDGALVAPETEISSPEEA